MAGLVVGRDLLFFLADDHGLALHAHQDLVLGEFEVTHGNLFFLVAGGQQGGLVDQVGQIGARETRSGLGQRGQIDALGHGDVLGVDLEDALAALDVGRSHDHLAVEAPRTQQGRVKHVRPVGGRHQDHALVALEAVHLDQQLVEGLLAFVVTATQAGAAMAADRVDLVDEDDAGRVLLALGEEIAHARGTHAHEHFDEVRARHAEEGHAGFAGHGLGQKRLARAGRTQQQHALGNLAAERGEALGFLEEFDDFLELFLGLVHAGHVGEGHLDAVLAHELGAAAAEAHGLAAARLHLAHEEDPDADQQQHRHPRDQHRHVPGRVLGRLGRDFDLGLFETLHQTGVGRGVGLEGLLLSDQLALDRVALDRDLADLALLHQGDEFAVRILADFGDRLVEEVDERQDDDENHHPERGALDEAAVAETLAVIHNNLSPVVLAAVASAEGLVVALDLA
ncbi:MAG: hypothetical protein BWY87_01504 [Deltaproteobacteria bacterium ADurb.Bin510]|nr:MAG: hypothetical protein BWY87_01504 [Deltaproteobacteria bacterium ADurb.Bin510]